LLTSALKQQFSRERQLSICLSEVLVKKRQSHGHQMSGRKLKFMKVDLVSRRVRIKLLFFFFKFLVLLGIFTGRKRTTRRILDAIVSTSRINACFD
jgi:hypothetical protein